MAILLSCHTDCKANTLVKCEQFNKFQENQMKWNVEINIVPMRMI